MKETILREPRLYFWLKDGRPIRSIGELIELLPTIPDWEYASHVTPENNDFMNWVRDVFQDTALSSYIKDARSSEELRKLLIEYYVSLEPTRESSAEDIPDTIEPTPDKKEEEAPVEATIETVHEPTQEFTEDPALVAERNEAIADRFDQAAKRLSEKARRDTPESLVKRIEILRGREAELRQEISAARKAGYDLFAADFALRRFPSRLELARVTEEEEDFLSAEELLKETKQEISEAQTHEPINVKKEVEALASN